MNNRRQRLEIALGILPYDPKTVQMSAAQQRVEAIITRLRTDYISGEDDSEEEGTAEGFAQQAMLKIKRTKAGNNFWDEMRLNVKALEKKIAILTKTAEQIGQTRRKLQKDIGGAEQNFDDVVIKEENASLANVEDPQLLEISIQTMNEARLKLLQQWERNKRKALDLLTVEIEKVQAMDQHYAQLNAQKNGRFSNGAEEHNIESADENEEPQKKHPCLNFESEVDHDVSSTMVTIGPNGTQVALDFLQQINWNLSGPAITRKLLCQVFDRDTLAFHTLSGKPSPAFKDCARPSKQQLDPHKVADMVHLMTTHLDMTARDVRTAITTKCADENKKLRAGLQRNPRQQK